MGAGEEDGHWDWDARIARAALSARQGRLVSNPRHRLWNALGNLIAVHADAALRRELVGLLVGDPTLPAYCSSKGAVRLLTKSVALHCARKKYGIRCNSVHPSFIDTPMVDRMCAGARDPEKRRAMLEAAAPLGRMGEPGEVALLILYLASDESRFVTGAELVIDGGLTAT